VRLTRRLKDEALLETARCGRCAHVLPDETLTFCPYCGVPFSRVPPTASYSALSSGIEARAFLLQKRRLISASLLLFASFWLLFAGASGLGNAIAVEGLVPSRRIDVYVWQHPDYPSLQRAETLQGVAIALQSFEDHFGQRLPEVRIIEDRLPPEMGPRYFETNDRFSALSFWEQEAFPTFTREWRSDPQRPLSVLLTNIPIVNDFGKAAPIEVDHLGAAGLVAGLGHPALALISSYRIISEEKRLLPKNSSAAEKSRARARYLGEYLMAHELGHALLGLADYVLHDKDAAPPSLRGPASLRRPVPGSVRSSTTSQDPVFARCLMHTDQGGGEEAWKQLQARSLGEKTHDTDGNHCPEYRNVLRGFELRAQAISLLKNGKRSEAEELHLQAIDSVRGGSQPWLEEEWAREHVIFLPLLRRWWHAVLG
jgi:hypothetical protein